MPVSGSVSFGLPYVNKDYEALGPIYLEHYISDTASMTTEVTALVSIFRFKNCSFVY